MNNFIFINPDINNCAIIYAQENDINKNKKGNLRNLLSELTDTSVITFVLSRYCAYKDTIDVPPKNKSIFLKNAENIIKQDLPGSNQKILIQPPQGNQLPFIVISDETTEILKGIQNQFKIEKNKVLLERDLYQSNSKKWYINLNDDELMIHYNNKVLQSSIEKFKEDIQVITDREKNPDLITWKYIFNKDQSSSKSKSLQLILSDMLDTDQKISYLMSDLGHIESDSFRSLRIKDVVNQKKVNISYSNNWKSYNYLAISLILFSALTIQYTSTSQYAFQIETRQSNILNNVFRDLESTNQILDLETVASKISYSNNLPAKNYIVTLNELGDMFNQPGLKLKKLEIDSDDINMVFIVEGESVINQINSAIQESTIFNVNINSIQNDNQNKIIVNLSVKYKNA